MHPQFAEWYRPLIIQHDDKFLTGRWALVEKMAKSLSIPMALDLVRQSFGLPVIEDAAILPYKQLLKSDGVNYVRAAANLELSLISDCAMLTALQQGASSVTWSHVVLASALACQHGMRISLRRPVQKEHLLASRSLLDRWAVEWRRTTQAAISKLEFDPTSLDDAPDPVTAENQKVNYSDVRGYGQSLTISIPDNTEINQRFAYLYSALTKASGKIDTKLAQLADAMNALAQASIARAAPQEENNIQWYLFGETSRDLQRKFASFQTAELIPIAAKELADLTTIVPGPYAAMAYLDRILTQGRPNQEAETALSLEAIVRAVQSLWKESGVIVSAFDGTQDLTPILCALSYATAGKDDWQTMVPELCKISLDAALPARRLAYQLYQEILFARLTREQLSSKRGK